jgi:exosortase
MTMARFIETRRALLFGTYSACLLAFNVGVVQAWARLAWTDGTASHLLLVPVVALALMSQRRRRIAAASALDPAAAALPLAAGIVLAWSGRRYAAGMGADALSVTVASVAVLWIAGFLLLYGRRAGRAALFPLLFLLFVIPIPSAVVAGVTEALKQGSARAVAILFTVTGTPFHQEGYVFSLPKFVIEIADECSGIRSSIALFLTTLLAAQMFLERPWKKVLLVAIGLPLAIVKNGVRIVSLSLLASYVDPGFLDGRLHHEGGIVFFVVTLGLLAPVLFVLSNSEKTRIKEYSSLKECSPQ